MRRAIYACAWYGAVLASVAGVWRAVKSGESLALAIVVLVLVHGAFFLVGPGRRPR